MINIRKWNQDKVFDITILIISTIILVMVLYPLFFVVIASISDPSAVANGEVILLPKKINLIGYQYIMDDPRIWIGYRNTIFYTVGGTFIGLFLTIPAGYALSRRDLMGKTFIMKMMVFTMYFSGGLIPTYLVVKGLRLIDTPYVLMIIGSFSVYNLIISRTYFANNIPIQLQEAAEIDGCTIPKFFFSIVMPLSKPIISIICLYYAVGHWNSFFSGLIYINSNHLYPLQLILRDILITGKSLQSDVDDPEMLIYLQQISQSIKYGVIIVSSLPILMMYPLIQKYFVKGVMIGSLKG